MNYYHIWEESRSGLITVHGFCSSKEKISRWAKDIFERPRMEKLSEDEVLDVLSEEELSFGGLMRILRILRRGGIYPYTKVF